MDINHLLDHLKSIISVSLSFRSTLASIVGFRLGTHREELLLPPSFARFVWYILKGMVIASVLDENGIESVVRIYLPGKIFTDLQSFLNDQQSTIKFTVMGETELLFIKRSDYKKHLDKFLETHRLIEQILMNEQKSEASRSRLLSYNNKEKVAAFAKMFPMNQIPNIHASSFLHIDPANYCRQKAAYNKENKD